MEDVGSGSGTVVVGGERRIEMQATRHRREENGVVSKGWWMFRARGTEAIS